MNATSKKNKLEWENQILKNNNEKFFKVLEYINTNEVHIEFIETGFKRIASLGNIKAGSVVDNMSPSVYNVGYIGNGIHKTKVNNVQEPHYKIWQAIIQRCYDKNCSSYKNYGEQGVIICEEWKNYQIFAEWYLSNHKDWMIAWELDKDILFKNSKIYSPATCCFVPKNINVIFTKRNIERGDYPIGVHLKSQTKKCTTYNTIIAQLNKNGEKIHLGCFKTVEEAFNAYKIAKENYIKEIASEYKDLLTEEVYQALVNYKVKITD